jgi:NitT/TauT family transport system substrate-binding protein
MKFKLKAGVLAAISAALALPAIQASAADKVSLRLAWLLNVQSAGYVMAKDKGFYSDAGLDVEILPGGPNVNSTALVATGANTFGTNDSGQVIFGKSEGMNLVIVAACFQRYPGGVLSLAKTGIREPKDLIGKTIAYNEGGPWAFTQAMLAKAGVDMSKIKTVVAIGNEVLMNGTVDAKTAFIVNEPIAVELAGFKTATLAPADYGVNAYAEAIFTSKAYLDANPDVVKRFVAATAKGWDYALAHQEEAVKAVLALDNQLDPEQQKRQLALEKDFIVTKDTEKNGTCSFNGETIKETEDVLLKYGGLKAPVPVEEIYSTAYLPKQ